ncbi:uncharacterized protein MYCGRDRAFT_90647 [Zymoseptoria tritici IPO323]|uniref:Autophagy-related protein 16 domain-containing protein n=1 Tax=Zymoseptoria tritici (strain CBS 115943 / IPO323) TaxID=336722 RepID=F9X4A9_ZYMTI|nr:uncharacterized protein MYCGRDRAFT_90647 [Zymoseptoria tritici IPO323]EGP89864.1 hypothetical protein MYCGRDRAFT_90647 [Zymoseptoria tritici IPO323]
MTDWLEQYSAALAVRDAREQAHKPYIDAFTRLADRTASAALTPATTNPPLPTSSSPASLPIRTSTPSQPSSTTSDNLTTLRNDLAANQKARALLSTQLSSLQTEHTALQSSSTLQAQSITRLTTQNRNLTRSLRDREEELKGKAKLVQDAQDEMVSLGLALSMAEQKAERLEGENRELVRRWVEYKEGEVERENQRRGWGD